jgi:hypothetical protein
LTLPEQWSAAPRGVYDLFALQSISPDGGKWKVEPLDPGEGRIYLVGTPSDFETDKREIQRKQVEEILRAQMPDLLVAGRYKADVSAVEKLRASALALSGSGQSDAAIAEARKAGETLASAIKSLTPYASLSAQLDETGRLLGAVEPAMYPGNKQTADKVANLRDAYWALQKRWSNAWEKTIQGQTDGLESEVAAIGEEARKCVAEIHGAVGEAAPN